MLISNLAAPSQSVAISSFTASRNLPRTSDKDRAHNEAGGDDGDEDADDGPAHDVASVRFRTVIKAPASASTNSSRETGDAVLYRSNRYRTASAAGIVRLWSTISIASCSTGSDMATLVHQCPHAGCLTARMNFEMRVVSHAPGAAQGMVRNFVHASCGGCGQPVAFEISDGDGRGMLGPDIGGYPLSLDQMGWHVVRMWPDMPKPRIPDHLPDQVVKPLMAAELLFPQKEMEEASASQYGRALDVGTKLYAPDLAGETLHNRIKKLAASNRITSSLAEWANAIRFIRNGALHDPDEIDRDRLIAIRGFTELVLTYLFTLPGMLKARQSETTEKPKVER